MTPRMFPSVSGAIDHLMDLLAPVSSANGMVLPAETTKTFARLLCGLQGTMRALEALNVGITDTNCFAASDSLETLAAAMRRAAYCDEDVFLRRAEIEALLTALAAIGGMAEQCEADLGFTNDNETHDAPAFLAAEKRAEAQRGARRPTCSISPSCANCRFAARNDAAIEGHDVETLRRDAAWVRPTEGLYSNVALTPSHVSQARILLNEWEATRLCRRHAPVGGRRWPIVKASEWCGEYEPAAPDGGGA